MEAILSAYLMMSMQAADDSPALSPGLISSHSADSCTHEHHCHCLEHLRELPFVHAVVDCVSRNSIGRIVASLTRNATDVLYPWAPWIISYHLATRVSLHVDEGGAEIVEVVADKKQSAVNWILPPIIVSNRGTPDAQVDNDFQYENSTVGNIDPDLRIQYCGMASRQYGGDGHCRTQSRMCHSTEICDLAAKDSAEIM